MEQSIAVTARAKVAFDAAYAALTADPAGVLGGAPGPNNERFTVPLAVELAAGSSLAQKVLVDFAPLSMDPGLARFGVCWQAVGHLELFPVFGGDLELRQIDDGTEVHLSGHYRVPWGRVGRFGDAVLGHRLARLVLEALVRDVTRRLESASVAEAG